MAGARTYVRYAHGEGHVGVAYLAGGERLVTAGADGEVRVWRDIDDDEPDSHRLGDTLTTVAVAGDRLLVGTDVHAVAAFRLSDMRPDGVLTRYTAPVTDISVAAGHAASAGCDMLVRVCSLDGERQLELDAFGAPVLSVALCPSARVLITTCCDGKATFWDARDGHRLAEHALLATCNGVETAASLARPGWSPDGRTAAVPVADGVQLFSGPAWPQTRRLTSPLVTSPVTCCTFSPCGRFVAAATADGVLLEWLLAAAPGEAASARRIDQSTSKRRINTLVWHPDGDQLAFSDSGGQLGVTSAVGAGRTSAASAAATPARPDDALMDIDSLVAAVDDDDEDERDLLEAAMDGELNTVELPAVASDDDDDDNVISLRRIKADAGFSADGGGDPEARATPLPPPPVAPPKQTVSEPQPAFQPGSTPSHLDRRFLVWNCVGVVTAHDGDSLDVEFHDSAVHHPLHLRNVLGHTLAALSQQALLLAAPSQSDDQPAKLQCLHFSSWDSNKEWYLDLPDGEEPEVTALGDGWLAVATSGGLLRVLTLTGIQRYVLSLAGPVVCLAGWEDRLLAVYHAGAGLPGQQCLAAVVLSATGRRHPRPAPVPVPLSAHSQLAWTGFTDQGSPCVTDTAGTLHLLAGERDAAWTPLAAPHPGADHLFVVGVSELDQTVRGLLCRGSRYPAVLPRPTLSALPLQVPLVELSTDRGRLEEEAARAQLLLVTLDRLEAAGFETEAAREQAQRGRAAALTQLFALACRTDREHRALDVASQMTEVTTVEAVAGYASRQRRTLLAERLMALAQALADSVSDQPSDEEVAQQRPAPLRQRRVAEPAADRSDESDAPSHEGADEEETPPVPDLPSLDTTKRATSPALFTPTPRNPFKCNQPRAISVGKGAAVFDDIKVQHAPVKRLLLDPKAKSAPKIKRPRVSKDVASKLTSMKGIFTQKVSSESTKNIADENEEEKINGHDIGGESKEVCKTGSGLAKLSAFAFADK